MDSRETIGRHEDGRIAHGVYRVIDLFVNCYVIKTEDNHWMLVDTGLKTAAPKIKKMVARLMGTNTKPMGIVLTHGHFDHVGSLKSLAEEWDVPVYAHPLEKPFLTGEKPYPSPDPSVGGGLMSSMSGLYPKDPVDVSTHFRVLGTDGKIPGLDDWKFIHTPGHAPGHISLFRESDRLLIAGDAFVTTIQESLLSVIGQTIELHGPPKYFTTDWIAAAASVQKLAMLDPDIAGTGHGMPMYGDDLREGLKKLVMNFEEVAVPKHGIYVPKRA